jgi:hypothetical protein
MRDVEKSRPQNTILQRKSRDVQVPMKLNRVLMEAIETLYNTYMIDITFHCKEFVAKAR